MRGERASLSVLLLALLTLSADTPPTAVDRAIASGETLQFDLSWLRITGGSATMTIAPVDGDATKLRITSLAQSSPAFSRIFHVRDEIESVISRETFSTLLYRKNLREGKRRKDETTVVDPERGIATRKGKEHPVPNPVFDPLSIIYHLRKLDLSPGNVHRFSIVADGKVYEVAAEVVERQIVATPAGRFKAVLVEPHMKGSSGVFRDDGSRLLIWYSDDELRLPLRIRSEVKFGTITATLRSWKNGTEAGVAADR